MSTTSRTVEPSPALLFGFFGVLFLPKAHNPPIQEKSTTRCKCQSNVPYLSNAGALNIDHDHAVDNYECCLL